MKRILLLIVMLVVFIHVNNNWIQTTYYSINMGQKLSGMKIVHLSDIHDKRFIGMGKSFYESIETEKPDIIVITGDLVDGRRYNEKEVLTIAEHLVDIAPVYYVSGNHEWYKNNFYELKDKLENIGMTVLDDESITVEYEKRTVQLIGLSDELKHLSKNRSNIPKMIQNQVLGTFDYELPTILLSHRPSTVYLAKEYGIDLQLSGHIHGGQVRIPIIGGILSPDVSLNPKLDAGHFKIDNTDLIVSRGIGNSIIPVRMFNRPEIIVIKVE